MKNLIKIACLVVLISCSSELRRQANSQIAKGPFSVNYDSLRVELEAMYDKDQEIRRKLDSVGFNSQDAEKFIAKMMTIDSVNQIHIKEILDEYGWLPKSKVGEKASKAIFYTIQHSDIESMEKYFPQLKELATNGEAEEVDAAMMEDRLLMWKGKKQKYGTQAYSNSFNNNRIFIWPIENPDSVNQLRKEVGFEQTVEEYAKIHNAECDRNEKLPNKN